MGSAGGGLGGVLIHTDSAEATFAAGLWEETLVHEAGHSLNDSHVSTDGWVAATEADGGFISEYAQDFPGSEDVTETFLRWFAVRYRLDRIAPEEASFILSQVPNRLAYFDAQNFDVSTPVPVPEPGTMGLLLAGLIAARVRLAPLTTFRRPRYVTRSCAAPIAVGGRRRRRPYGVPRATRSSRDGRSCSMSGEAPTEPPPREGTPTRRRPAPDHHLTPRRARAGCAVVGSGV